jgi:Gpi18-like mannosyltransferase
MSRSSFLRTLLSWRTCALLVVIILAAYARAKLWTFESADYTDEISRWYDFISAHGFRAFKEDFYPPYTPLYLYTFYLGTILLPGLPKLLVIKLISILFDFVCAFFVYRLVRLRYATGSAPLFASTVVLLAPTVVWNSSLWAQCDALYTAGLLGCVYFLAIRRNTAAFLCYGAAFALKLQSIFLAPLLLILLLKGIIHWKHLLIVPVVYVVSILPAWFAGRPLFELLTAYFRQLGFYRGLSLNAPNMYQWFPQTINAIVYPTGLILGGVTVLLFCLCVYASRTPITTELLVYLATLSVLIVPFVLPRMHERYFFPADVLSIALAFYFPRFVLVPLVVQAASLFSYFPFLFGYRVISLSILAAALLLTIVILSVRLVRILYAREPVPALVSACAVFP